jgi:SAM-dependent methyltransferase
MSKLDKALHQQIELNKTKNMLYARLGQIIEIDPDFLAALEELLAGDPASFSKSALQSSVSFASELLIKRLHVINQFIQVSELKKRELAGIYRRTWQRIVGTKNIQATLKDHHYPELANWIASLYPEGFRKHLRDLPTVGQVVCEEYSPRLQIDLLRLDIQTLQQPVLDIGCGSRAGLTRYLRSLGIEAYGLDRQIKKGERYLQQADWLEYRFEPGRWGSILSNMAFTNHLHYTNHHDRAQLELYLQKFKEILESLRIGGSFYYAPDVPFIEERLDARVYRVERFDVIRNIQSTRIARVAR